MTDTATLEAILDDARTDLANRFHLYRVAADAARDMGEDGLAFGLDWLAENGRQPMLLSPRLWGWLFYEGRPAWLEPNSSWSDYHHHLPFDIGRHLETEAKVRPDGWSGYRTFAAAVLDAARAVAVERFGKVG